MRMQGANELFYIDMWAGDMVHERKLTGIRWYAESRGWKVRTLGDADSRPRRLSGILAAARPVGCIVECSSGHEDLPPRIFRGIPTVYLDGPPRLYGNRVPRVIHDGKATVREAFRELASANPQVYAVVGHAEPYFWSRQRAADFRRLVTKSGRVCHVFPASRGCAAGLRARRLADWVGRLPRQCALFTVNDFVARETLAACRAAGRKVPSDIILVSVDNCEEICERSEPKISSVQIDFEAAGHRAAKMVDSLASQGDRPVMSFGPLMTVRRASTRRCGRCEPRLLSAIDLIRREACNGLRAHDVAELFGGSRRLVDLRFRETFGHSILNEIQNVRFEKVFTLLAHTDKSLGMIADLCGFRSEITLREQFRRRVGLSMTAWRAENASGRGDHLQCFSQNHR